MRRAVRIVLVLLLLGGAWLAATLYLPYQGFSREGVFVDIPHGASARTIARLLTDHGVVRSRLAFELLARLRSRRVLQAGEYFFDRPMTPSEVFTVIAEGRVYTLPLVVPEGYSQFEIADLVEREGLTSREAFLAAARDPTPIRDLAPTARSAEGFLFPATYRFPRHMAAPDIVVVMVRRFREAWAGLPGAKDEADVLSKVTLASLVERETPLAEERPIIAGVFANRLQLRRPLECDPTVVYALELAGRYRGALDPRDLYFPSSYNTYRHAGLPPGPIANPGESSLRAALHPEPTDYLYFVANAQGGHFFSRTLAEHNRNVARYRRLLAQNGHAPNGASRHTDPPPSGKAAGTRPR